ncbi:MAG TPA: hypothetical protein VFJ30_07755 [Phycisphaerae bacterium]|nr:hypothetical protein [Phycisphaerae bacterium]
MRNRIYASICFILPAVSFLAGEARAADVTGVTNLLTKADAGALTADDHAEMVQGLVNLMDTDVDAGLAIRLAQWSHKSLTAEEKAQIRTKLLERLAGTATQAAKLSVQEVREATIAFDQLEGASEKGRLGVAWMAACEAWKSAGPEPLVRLLWALNAARPEEAAEARTAWAGQVWTTHLCSQADPARATGPEYAELAIQAHQLLSTEQGKELSGSMVVRLTRAGTAAQLVMEDIRKARQTLSDLDNQLGAADVIAAWVAHSQAWKQITLADVAYLCYYLEPKADEDGPRAAMMALVELARSGNLLSDTDVAAEGEAEAWVPALADAMATAEGPNAKAELAANIVTSSDEWKKWSPNGQVWLAESVARSATQDAAQRTLVDHWAAVCARRSTNASDPSPHQWRTLAACLSSRASADVRKAWAADLARRYADGPAALAQMSQQDFDDVTAAIGALDKPQAANLVLARAGGPEKVRALSPTGLAALAGNVKATDAPAAMITGELLRRARASDTQYGEEDYMAVARAWFALGNVVHCNQWAMRAYRSVLGHDNPGAPAPVTEERLRELARFLREVKLHGKGRDYPEYGRAVAALGREGKLPLCDSNWRVACDIGWLLRRPASRRIVEAEMVGPDEQLRPAVGKVVCWAYVTADEDKQLFAMLDARLGDPDLKGQGRIPWLLLRAYAASLRGDPSPSFGRAWMEEAFALSTSPAQRSEIAMTLAVDLAKCGKCDEAARYLDGVAGQLKDPKAPAAMAEARRQIARSRAVNIRRRRDFCLQRMNRLKQDAKWSEGTGDMAAAEHLMKSAKSFQEEARALTAQLAGRASPAPEGQANRGE